MSTTREMAEIRAREALLRIIGDDSGFETVSQIIALRNRQTEVIAKALLEFAAAERAATIGDLLKLLRSEEAENAPKPFAWNFVVEKSYNTARGWADWIESSLAQAERGGGDNG